MPVPTDQLAEAIGELKSEVKELARGIADLRTEPAGFRGGVESELRIIRWVGAFFAGGLFSVILGAITVAWNGSAVVSEVRQQGTRLEKMEHRLDTFGENVQKQLEILIRRTEPKAG